MDVKQTPNDRVPPLCAGAAVGDGSSDYFPARQGRVASGTQLREPRKAEHERQTVDGEGRIVIEGGNIYDCLSNHNIDRPIQLLLGKRAIPARYFYDVRTGEKPAKELTQLLSSLVAKLDWVLMPIHTRFHWATAIIRKGTRNPNSLAAYILDSAPSPITWKDFHRVLESLEITEISGIRYFRQKNRSNDCGLHVILIALIMRHRGDGSLPEFRTRKFILKKWRPILDECERQGKAPSVEDFLTAFPKLTDAFRLPQEKTQQETGQRKAIEGGGPRKAMHNRPATPAKPTNASAVYDTERRALQQTTSITPFQAQTVCTITPIHSPLLKRPVSTNTTNHIIDVDAIEVSQVVSIDDTMFSMDDLQREGVMISPKIRKIFNSLAKDRDKDQLHLRQAEKLRFNALSKADQNRTKHRHMEEMKRLTVTEERAMARLKDLRNEFVNDKAIWNLITKAVKSIQERLNLIIKEEHRAETFEGKTKGALISDRIVEWVMEAAQDVEDWTLIPPGKFALFANIGSPCTKGPVKSNVAAIIQIPGHYLLIYWTKGKLYLQDSLYGTPPFAVDEPRRKKLGRFLSLVGIRDATPVEMVPCRKQATNECAIESLNNLIEITTGYRGTMSRDLIRQVEQSSDPYNARHIWRRAWPAKAEPDPESTSRRTTQRCEDTKRDISSCIKCMRQTVAGIYCGWHHPTILAVQDRLNCAAISNKGTPCCELALKVGGTPHCQYHLSAAERKRIKTILENSNSKTTHMQTTAPSTTQIHSVGETGKALPHAAVRKFLNTLGAQTLLELELQLPCGQLIQVIANIKQVASSRPVPHEGVITVKGRFCGLCNEWHTSEGFEYTVPTAGTTYYTMKSVNINDRRDMTDECKYGDAGSDVSDDEEDETNRVPDDIIAQIGRECLSQLPTVSISHTIANVTKHWSIVRTGERPQHIPGIVWRALSQGSRDVHIRWLMRLKHYASDLTSTNLPTAAVETVTRLARDRKWAWSTIASALSAVASALINLRCYSNQIDGIDIRSDPFYRAAMQYSQKMARVNAIRPKDCTPLTVELFKEKAKLLRGHTGAWILWQLSWYLAARVGDARRLDPENVTVDDDVDEHNTVAVRALFTQGKGAHFWGPYTIHARIPVEVAKVVKEVCRTSADSRVLCSAADQRRISEVLRECPGHSIRSIRRGSLVYYANCGASDKNLLKLSGHRNEDTLLRYLGWGQKSSEAAAAATERSNLAHIAAEVEEDQRLPDEIRGAGNSTAKPMWMGQYSGFNGRQGKRIAAPPELFPKQTPSHKDLGIELPSSPDGTKAQWKLHVKKDLACINLNRLQEIVHTPELKNCLSLLLEWIQKPSHYGVEYPPLAPAQIPFAGMMDQHIVAMLEGPNPKLRPIPTNNDIHTNPMAVTTGIDNPHIVPLPPTETVRCGVRAFVVPQEAKQRLRPIFAPLYNYDIERDALPELHYPSRLERRINIAKAKLFIQFDFSAFYDQIMLGEDVMLHHVLRARAPILCNGVPYSLFALTREPMGSTHSAHVAQYITWSILEPILKMSDVGAATCIDNVAIFGDNESSFVEATQIFLNRCKLVGATLNDQESIPSTPKEILKRGREKPQVFLGEVYLQDGTVLNTESNVKKLRLAYERLQATLSDPNITVTKRNVAALIGLWTWLAHTIQDPLNRAFEVLRLHSSIAASINEWDDPIKLSPTDISAIGKAIAPVLMNRPTRPYPAPVPSTDHRDYAATVIVDASRTGFGAIALVNGQILEVKGGFFKEKPHSAHAEPLAATLIVEWVRRTIRGPIAVVSDHIALTQAQRRPGSGNGGFGKSFFLNNFLKELYSDGLHHQIFYVQGDLNPADAASRSNKVGDPISVTVRPDTVLPSLASFYHPFLHPKQRQWWTV